MLCPDPRLGADSTVTPLQSPQNIGSIIAQSRMSSVNNFTESGSASTVDMPITVNKERKPRTSEFTLDDHSWLEIWWGRR
ncbi:hypothetical protein ASPCAL05434 [Aspergillus calidoustus]|uniref:Uncharacterized protein n=1 Tax=Aspergillus calidoustus TaxID=454130 RepID=A0A0U5FXL8_ASPCI|nr:hypothetical protein ASPCAL05434 [Aspergillus calidoustus]